MRDEDQRAPAIGTGGRSSSARQTDCVAGRNAVKSAHSYCTPDHPPCACASCGDWIDDGGIYAVDSLRRPVCDDCSMYVSSNSNK